jgi:deazaflavin-dependent oxidoreductase (nitroreductase family)
MGWFSNGLRRAGRRRWFSAAGSRLAAPIDKALFTVSHHWLDAPLRRDLATLMLFTTGRKTGKMRRSPLLYLETGSGWAVVGTNWGRPDHPGWSANLLADPRAAVAFGDHTEAVSARNVEGEEFDTLWTRFVEMWPAFADYRDRIDRQLRMFVLEAREPAPPGP